MPAVISNNIYRILGDSRSIARNATRNVNPRQTYWVFYVHTRWPRGAGTTPLVISLSVELEPRGKNKRVCRYETQQLVIDFKVTQVKCPKVRVRFLVSNFAKAAAEPRFWYHRVRLLVTADTSKAFDSVEHGRLLDKLGWYGIDGRWFAAWLSDRTQTVTCAIDSLSHKCDPRHCPGLDFRANFVCHFYVRPATARAELQNCVVC